MTEQSSLQTRDTIPRKSIPFVVLGLCLLLAANIGAYAVMIKKGLIPNLIALTPSLETGTPPVETSVTETVLKGISSVGATLTFTPPAQTPPTKTLITETPGLTETPIFSGTHAPITLTSTPSLTPAIGSCQYTIKPGPKDFLNAIYWNWHINKNIPVIQKYYTKIFCATLLSNIKCTYKAATPGITQPGWILVLPGVLPNICFSHGGTPVP